MTSFLSRCSLTLLLLFPCTLMAQQQLPTPTGPVILTISGAITTTNREGAADFDAAMLKQLPQHAITTATPWTEGESQYQGIKLADLFLYLGAKPKKLYASALNHYSIEFDYKAVEQYPVILARTKDGQPMKVRDKGPLWILYPMTDHPELNSADHHSAMVWQLRSIEVR